EFKEFRQVRIVACGTSWHAALAGKFMIERLARIPVEVDYGSEFRYRDPIVGRDTLTVVISQSGETADTLAAQREARQKGSTTIFRRRCTIRPIFCIWDAGCISPWRSRARSNSKRFRISTLKGIQRAR